MVSGKKIALWILTGRLLKRQFAEFIKFQKGACFYRGFPLNLHWLVGYLLKLVPSDHKQKVLNYFFAGLEQNLFQEKCDFFAENILPGMIRPSALAEIEVLRHHNFEIVVVSASVENWIMKWTNHLSLKLIATRLEVKNGKITGGIEGRNCRGEQKVVCILERWNLDEYNEIYAYGNSPDDKPMLALATKTFYKPFRNT
jgi:HAD superfamily phosphoserine phosphatase-like hydrolase